MQRRDNPYTPGASWKPAYLAGREDELEDFRGLIDGGSADRSLLYCGVHGVGKSVLLMELEVLASEVGWVTSDVHEVGPRSRFRSTFAEIASRLLREFGRRHVLGDRTEHLVGMLRNFKTPEAGDLEEDLVEIVREIGVVADTARSGAVLFIDEMQNLDPPSLSALCVALQAAVRETLPIVLVGAGLPDLQAKMIREKPYADRLFDFRELGGLSDPDARAALVNPAAALDVEFEFKAALEAVRAASGVPYFLQAYGRELWNAAACSPITLGDVQEVRDLVNDQLGRTFYGRALRLATESEQRYLLAMASLGSGPYSTSEIAKAWGADNQRRTSPHRDSLLRKGLIWSPSRGQVDFTMPLFDEYLRRRLPNETGE